ncbi:MAG: hypothetical protein ACE37H_14705 [Phycisphaeraceae bacterium]
MSDPPTNVESQKGRAGPVLARAGVVLCGLAMVVGFFLAVAMNLFDDPEEPSAIYGKLFVAVLLVMVLGIAVALVGAAMPKPPPPAPRPRAARPADDSDLATGDADESEPEASNGPAMRTRDWDEAFAADRRRR